MCGLSIVELKDNNPRASFLCVTRFKSLLRMNATLSPSLFNITLPLLNEGKGRRIRKEKTTERRRKNREQLGGEREPSSYNTTF
jgi:hypothetical protein